MIERARDNTRHELLVSGLADWVHLGEIHYQVEEDNPDFTIDQVRRETLDTIASVVRAGLFQVGDLSGANGEFVPWDAPLDESLKRISDVYLDQFANETAWLWVFWLEITEKGRLVAAGGPD